MLPIPLRALHAFVGGTWRLRLQQTDSGWVEMAAGAPIMDTGRIRNEFGWEPQTPRFTAIQEVIDGMGKVPACRPLRRSNRGAASSAFTRRR